MSTSLAALKIWGIGAGIVFMLSLSALWWFSPFPPLFDDGPFYGESLEVSRKGELVQSFPFRDNMTLLVYERLDEYSAPIVHLQNEQNQLVWEILAIGLENTFVDEIEFKSVSCSRFLLTCKISGVVTWTYGKERMNWYIWKWGSLRNYYYSW